MRHVKRYQIVLSCFLFAFVFFYACTGNNDPTKNIPETISYNYDVRPILSDKCFNCHGPDAKKREAGLRLDMAPEAYKALQEHPGKHAIVPGNPQLSELFLRVSTKDTSLRMPLARTGLPGLNEHEIGILKKWISQGAVYEPHWAFVVPVKKTVPEVSNKEWPVNEIDHFIFKKMEEKGLEPNEVADKERLAKRAFMDLTGILPTEKETDQFTNDKDPAAYEKMIDRLLLQPQFGERMAISWLDIARYADSHGFQDDNYRSQWPWRDWVISAFNRNMRYDTFITWQMAGDLLPNPTKEQLLATGFNRNHKITEEGGVIDEEYRLMYVQDRTVTFSRAMLAMTVECAKCHDHKYDPILQKDYYQLAAFFNNVTEVGLESTVGGPETFAKNPRMRITNEDVSTTMKFINKPDTNKLEVSVMADRDTAKRKTFILSRGNYDMPMDSVSPSTPAAILPFDRSLPKNRLGLAKWLFDKKNPLTARVFVNRMWQEFFGRGFVKTTADFGMQGELPTHPELLDWLAVDFSEHGWDIKRLIKQFVMSATYRQSSKVSKEKLKTDPLNLYWSYAPRVRYPAEIVRDMLLVSSGLLNRSIGGPSVKPYQPPGLWEMATSGRGLLKKYVQDTGLALYRRGIYTFIKRTVPPPSMMLFDASNRDECQTGRYRTNTPLQALIMLNDPTMLEASKALADKLLQQYPDPEKMVEKAFRSILCRMPSEKERELLVNYWKDAQKEMDLKKADQLITVGAYQPKTKNKINLAAAMQTIQVIYNMQEAITKS
ncbi:MAG: PSD1 and planctomycete cytochrome C domain-containing protein [Bacteroidota bacterium]